MTLNDLEFDVTRTIQRPSRKWCSSYGEGPLIYRNLGRWTR